MKRIECTTSMLLFACLGLLLTVQADDTNTDPARKFAWGENVGWINAAPTNASQTVGVHYYEGEGGWLSGHVWCENVGWIKMGADAGGPYANTTADDWGVNIDGDGKLSGYAWGENVGWINFEQTHGQSAIDPDNGEFSGHVWGENIGWLKFKGTSPDYGVRTLAFDTQPQGTPNWWLAHHAVSEAHDEGDGVPAWRKYVMDTDPNVAGDYLRITAVSNTAESVVVDFCPASIRRFYTLVRRDNLASDEWSNVAGQVAVQYGTDGEKTMQDTNTEVRVFYSIKVETAP